MRCPACQQAAEENAAECACGFSLAALDKIMGIPPSLKSEVTDMVNELTGGEVRRITAEIHRLERRFPQANFAVVVCSPPEGATLATYLFWLFNRGGVGSAIERGGMSRLVMLGLDPVNGKAACMLGYGLEPFIAEARLTAALNAAFPSLATDQIGKGIEQFLSELERQMIEAASETQKAFGLGTTEFESVDQFEANDDVLAY